MRQMLGAIAQWEKSVIVQKLRAARMRIRKSEGRCEGRKPYGSKESEQSTLARMIELRGQGLSIADVAERLNGEGVKPRAGAKWHATAVQRILARKN
jgi:DNA invertase Pin-like site-specific DNA recombinase